ncbi:aminopeptidase [Desulfovibrio sp. OttesenSCG-928-G15]|nr:aminopeptidase [Desulfovibrio sp. OttesenSCG-928-G15]
MPDFEFTPKSAWESYSTPKEEKAVRALAERYVDFLSRCKTERETIAYVKERLAKAGYNQSYGNGKVMRDLQGKSLFIARRGKAPLARGLRFIGAHADTPRLDFKQRPLLEQAGVGQAKTHYYGGLRKYQWLARPLAIHGVVVKQDGTLVNVALGEAPTDPVFTIADLLPHLAREQAGQTVSKAFSAERLNLILAHKPLKAAAPEKSGKKGKKAEESKEPVKARILALLHERYGIIEEDLYSAELQAVPAGPARFVGLDEALVGGYGHDDRICVFCALEALLNSRANPAHTQCIMLWDKEEIGSEGSTGAKSRFFEYCVQDMLAAWEPKTRFSTVMLETKGISADVHAAIDPDWQELHEKLNSATLGYGPCMCKFTGSGGKYEANDAHPEYIAWLRDVFNSKKIPWQMAELGKVDGGGGGTVAMYLAAYGMNIIDCGPTVLGMHSPFELASAVDVYATTLAFTAFFDAK